jgi:PPK2 family polyphosphate:nucleotide phosphotransferase
MADHRLVRLASRFTVTNGKGFRLGDVDPGDTKGFSATKEEADTLLAETVQQISSLQETLYAQDQWSVLLIFQAMDAAGKDSAIKHVFSGINPQGVQVFSFKAPSAEELDHDFLWRTTVRLPERGRIGVFNRSYYEEVLVVRVHRELLQSERLPEQVVGRGIWSERFDDITAFERHLARSGYLIRKFFLHVSRDEQARRFIKRLDEPDKRWKFSMGDVRERERWPEYMKAYEDAVQNTSTAEAPWVVVPADRKWFARLVIAGAVLGGIEQLQLRPPKVSAGHERELEDVRAALARELGESEGRQGGARKKR